MGHWFPLPPTWRRLLSSGQVGEGKPPIQPGPRMGRGDQRRTSSLNRSLSGAKAMVRTGKARAGKGVAVSSVGLGRLVNKSH